MLAYSRLAIAFFVTLALTGTYTLAHAADYSVLVETFRNSSKNKDFDWVGQGLADSLTTELATYKNLSVISYEATANMMHLLSHSQAMGDKKGEMKSLETISKALGSSHVVFGSYEVKNGTISINAKLYERGSAAIKSSATVADDVSKISEMQVQLARKLIENMSATKATAVTMTEDNVAAYEHYSRGLLLHKTNPQKAELEYKNALQLSPNFARAQYQLIRLNLGERYETSQREDLRQRINALKAYLERRKEDRSEVYANVLRMEGILFDRFKEYDKALQAYESSRSILESINRSDTVDYLLCWNNTAATLYEQRKLELSLQIINETEKMMTQLGLKDSIVNIYLLRNRLDIQLSRQELSAADNTFALAFEALKRLSLEETSRHAEFLHTYAVVKFMSDGNVSVFKKTMKRILSFTARNHDRRRFAEAENSYYWYLLRHYWNQKEPKNLIATANEAIKRNIHVEVAYLSRAMAKIQLGKLNAAEKDLEKSIGVNPNHPDTWYYLGQISRVSNDYPKAISHYNKAMKIWSARSDSDRANFNVSNFDILEQRALCYVEINNADLAVTDLTEILEQSSDPETRSNALNTRGYAYARMEKYPDACVDFSAAIALGNKVASENHKSYCRPK